LVKIRNLIRRIGWDRKIGTKLRWLVFSGIGTALVALSLIITPSYASEDETVVHIETTEQTWQRVAVNAVNFKVNPLSKALVNFKIEITLFWDIEESVDRTTIIIYKIFSNGVYVDQIRHSLNLRSGRGSEKYDTISIPSDTLKSGENTAKFLMTFNSTASKSPSGPESFYCVISHVINTDNSKFAALIILLFLPISITLAEKGRARSKGKRRE